MVGELKFRMLMAAVLLLSGCSDELTLVFKKDVDLQEKALQEIRESLDGVARINHYEWHTQTKGFLQQPALTIKFKAVDGNDNYSVAQVSELLVGQFSYSEKDVSIARTITEDREEFLEKMGVETGQKFTTNLYWGRARANVFYTEESSRLFGGRDNRFVDRNFFCAIEVPMEDALPSVSFSYASDNPNPIFAQLMKNMVLEAKNETTIDGLPVNEGWENLEIDNDRKVAFIMFEYLGEMNNQVELVLPVSTSTPNNVSKRDCLDAMKEKLGSTLYGVLGEVSAMDNVLTVGEPTN